MSPSTSREGERARRSQRIVRLGDSRRRRLTTGAVIVSRQPRFALHESSATSGVAAEADELIWFG